MQQYQVKVKSAVEDGWANLELAPNEVIALTFETNKIAQMEKKKAFLSNIFKLPRTPNNTKHLGFPGEMRSGYMQPWTKIPARLYVKGMEVTQGSAFVYVVGLSKKYIELVVTGGIVEFLDIIRDKSIREDERLKVLFPGVRWTAQGVTDSWQTNTPVPVMDWNTEDKPAESIMKNEPADNSAPPFMNIRALRPCIRLKALLEAIVTGVGYTLDTDVANEPEYANMLVGCTASVPDPDFYKGEFEQNDEIYSILQFYNFSNLGTANGTFTANGEKLRFRHDFEGTYTFNIQINNTGTGVQLRVLRNGAREQVINIYSRDKLKVVDIKNVEALDVIEFQIHSLSSTPPLPVIRELSIEVISYTAPDVKSVPVGRIYPVVPNLPDVTQFELFMSFLRLYGLTLQIDNRRKIVKCYTLQYVRNTRNERGHDWTDKMDARREDIEPSIDDYAQTNIIKYKDFEYTDQDDKERTLKSEGVFYAGGWNGPVRTPETLIIQNTLLPKKELYDFLGVAVADSLHFRISDMAKVPVLTGGEITADAPFTYLCVNTADMQNYSGAGYLQLSDGAGTINAPIIQYASFIPAQRLINKFYDVLDNHMLKKTFVLTGDFNLDVTDVYDFDHSCAVFLGQYCAWFYVNKVAKYVPELLTECELIKIAEAPKN